MDKYEPLPRKYINEMYQEELYKEFDHKYGVRLDINIKIHNWAFKLGYWWCRYKKKRYRGTQGLYELPKNSTCEDVENYKQIVMKSYAHKAIINLTNK